MTIRPVSAILLCAMLLLASALAWSEPRPRIAVFSGPRATVQSSPPLVTSAQSTEYQSQAPTGPAETTGKQFDHLRPQRLAAPVEVWIEMFSAHPLEKDAADLYAEPDAYLDTEGNFHEKRRSEEDIPVLRAVLRPEDGLFLLPYMALQADGSPWQDDCTDPGAPATRCRQPFYPDASRIFEEIDRGLSGLGPDGTANILSRRADFDFFRALPSGGYRLGLHAEKRSDVGRGDIPREVMGEDFFAYKPFHLGNATRFRDLARLTNKVAQALDSDQFLGALWLEASPSIEETLYWLNLLVDTRLPLAGVAAQRPHGEVSADGPRNIVDAVDYVVSRKWQDESGQDRMGVVMVDAEQIFASRQVQKTDARPGGYVATGDHGGVLGTVGRPGDVRLWFVPTTSHTWNSEVNSTRLPRMVNGVSRRGGVLRKVEVEVKDEQGLLLESSMPHVAIVKGTQYSQPGTPGDALDKAIVMLADELLEQAPLAGFVAEGEAPYGNLNSFQTRALERAVFMGMPTVSVGRGNAGGLTATRPHNLFIEGDNLTASKARMLLMACLLKFGSLPPANDPDHPTAAEKQAVRQLIEQYQRIFDTH